MKILKVRLIDCIIFALTFIVSFIGISVSVGVLNFRQHITDYPLYVLLFFIFLLIIPLRFKKKIEYSNSIVFLLFVVLAAAISLIIHRESLSPAICIFLIILIINRCTYINSNKLTVIFAIALASVPYMRIVSRSNSMAINFCLIGIALLSELYEKKMYKSLLAAGFIFEYMIIITYSRTCAIVFTVIYVFYAYKILLLQSGKYKKIAKILLVIAGIFALYLCYDAIYGFFTSKWGNINSGNEVDFTSGRLVIWQGTLTDGITLFGNGKNYFALNFNKADSHNIFIEILGRYGLVATIFFICFTFTLFKKAIKTKDTNSIFFLTAYYLLGMGENILILNTRMIVPTIIFYLYVNKITQNNPVNTPINNRRIK